MDEIEMRVAALETFCIEVGAWLDPQALDDAARSLRDGLDGAAGDERAVKLQALQLIEDARKRFAGPERGVKL